MGFAQGWSLGCQGTYYRMPDFGCHDTCYLRMWDFPREGPLVYESPWDGPLVAMVLTLDVTLLTNNPQQCPYARDIHV